tara:strand:- start:123 stop:347 length:225 start_codon:yes stop_codon:yes gene_type:complete
MKINNILRFRSKMGNSLVDRDANYMKRVWGTASLTTDYGSTLDQIHQENQKNEEKVLQEIMHDDLKTGQNNLQE